jgi:hypothetical protein
MALARYGAVADFYLIRKAWEIEQREPLGIDYVHSDVAAPESPGSRAFDLVACTFGLSDIDDLDGAITAIRC